MQNKPEVSSAGGLGVWVQLLLMVVYLPHKVRLYVGYERARSLTCIQSLMNGAIVQNDSRTLREHLYAQQERNHCK